MYWIVSSFSDCVILISTLNRQSFLSKTFCPHGELAMHQSYSCFILRFTSAYFCILWNQPKAKAIKPQQKGSKIQQQIWGLWKECWAQTQHTTLSLHIKVTSLWVYLQLRLSSRFEIHRSVETLQGDTEHKSLHVSDAPAKLTFLYFTMPCAEWCACV